MKNSIKKTLLITNITIAILSTSFATALPIKPTKQIDTCECTCAAITPVGSPLQEEKIAIQNRQCGVDDEGGSCSLSEVAVH
ncbi:MAG: hypothetical protein V3U71_08215 [Cocleimonas sp.]